MTEGIMLAAGALIWGVAVAVAGRAWLARRERRRDRGDR